MNSAHYGKNARGIIFTFLGIGRKMFQRVMFCSDIVHGAFQAYEDSPCPRSAADACILRLLFFGHRKVFFARRAPKSGLARRESCILSDNPLHSSIDGCTG